MTPKKIIVVLEDVGLAFATRNDVGAVLRITLEFEVTNESEVLNGHIARFLDGGCEALVSQGGEFSFMSGYSAGTCQQRYGVARKPWITPAESVY